MTVTAWFHAFSGIAGDMALGACIDAGADVDEINATLRTLPIQGWRLHAEPVLRCGIAATKAVVHAPESGVVRTAAHIRAMIDEATLPDRVRVRALATVDALAAAEGKLHRRPASQVHFHEVGGLDAIIDIVGTCIALELLGVDTVTGGPVATGVGMVRAAHGMLPVPAPAVVELLKGAPVTPVDLPYELTTPTGAALLAALVTQWGAMPAMTVAAVGYGAGTRELDHRPNVTQLVIGEAASTTGLLGGEGHPLVELAVNVDDVTGETLAHCIAALIAGGAHDAWVTPIVMKKGRPAHLVTALCDTALSRSVAEILVAETGSLGIRATGVERWAASRQQSLVSVDGHPIRVKVSPGRTKIEHDDAALVAARTGRPLRDVISLAEEAARRAITTEPSTVASFDPTDDTPA
jgi:uncharacterized protein (TIGR00299 family) protein